MSRRTRVRLLGLTALVGGVFFFWSERQILPGSGRPAPPQKNADLVEAVVRLIRNDYVEEPDASKTMRGGFQGMINSLDALSSFLDKAEAQKLADPGRSRFKDLGLIVFKRASSFPVVVGIIEGSPAEKEGIRVGDVISALDDRSTVLQGLQEVRLYLKDALANPVKVRLIRDNQTKEIEVSRGSVYERAYSFRQQAGTAGILTIHHFYPPLVETVKREILPKLTGARGTLILDLRRAFEGENDEARRFLNLFIHSDKAGVFEKKGGVKEPLTCPDAAPLENRAVVVWTDQTTMGPAEIVAACLRSVKKAKIVGLLSPGLAAHQDIFPLPSGDALLLTTGVFVTASGEKIWAKGIAPDVRIDVDQADSKTFLEKTRPLLSRLP